MNFKPHAYQEEAIKYISEKGSCALWLDMGLGKTACTLLALKELKEREDTKVLIVAPLRVAHNTWSGEIEKWDQLKDISYTVIKGAPRKRLELLGRNTDIHLINYELLSWLVMMLGKEWPYDTVVFDEFSKMKSHRTQRFKAFRKVKKNVKRVIGLTGTPASNGLMDLWTPTYLLDGGKRLGKTFTKFREEYFTSDYMGYNWYSRPNAEKKIHRKLKDICLSMSAEDYLTLPDRIDNIIPITLPAKARKTYDELEKEFITELGSETITALNAAAMANKCLQAANGAIYNEEGEPVYLHDEKLSALDDVIEEAEGAPVLVAYNYKSDAARIQAKFKQAKILTQKVIKKWNRGEVPLLLAHPASAAHGLNLQAGGNIIVWFGLNWSLENYQQFNARLHRQGQTKPVFVHHIVAEDTIDERVMKVLGDKDAVQNGLINAMKHSYL